MSAAIAEQPVEALARHRGMITLTVMVASILQALDTTIANVALPHMQGSFSATLDQMDWVLTSYIIAAAIMTPLTGWLADRFGRKRLFLFSIITFTVSSAMCGMAQSLTQMVVFRLIQGVGGAALVPMSQAMLFDTYPREQHGRAMSLWGFGVVLGPTIGPILGGWLTDNYSWRWVFYINVPFGVLAVLGVLAFFPETRNIRKYFDFFGFAMLSVFIGALQLLLDRGPSNGWFGSGEIRLYAAVAIMALYLFVTHTLTFKRPFIRLALYQDRNFLAGNVLVFVVGIVLFATLALLPPMLQQLMGYSVFQSGLVTAPRGVGTLIAMIIVGQAVGRVDSRLIIGTGFVLTAISLWQMTGFSLQMNMSPVVWSGVVQGLGVGIVYVPMAAVSFATLPAALRNEGTALFNLLRNVGSSVGISAVQGLLVRNTQVVHSSLAAHVTPFSVSIARSSIAAAAPAATALNAAVTTQANMVAYLDDFQVMLWLTLLALPLLLLLHGARRREGGAAHVALE